MALFTLKLAYRSSRGRQLFNTSPNRLGRGVTDSILDSFGQTTVRVEKIAIANKSVRDMQRQLIERMEQALEKGEAAGKRVAPVDTGRLRAGIQIPNYTPPMIRAGSRPGRTLVRTQNYRVRDRVFYAKYQERRFEFMETFMRRARADFGNARLTGRLDVTITVSIGAGRSRDTRRVRGRVVKSVAANRLLGVSGYSPRVPGFFVRLARGLTLMLTLAEVQAVLQTGLPDAVRGRR